MGEIEYAGTDNLEVMAEAVKYNRFLVDLVYQNAPDSDVIVDFGAGIGTFAEALLMRGLKVTCIEPDRRQAQAISDRGMRVVSDIDGFNDESIDLVYSLNVLEHIEDDESILRSITRKLRRNGRLLIYVPAFQLLYSSMDRKVGHVRRYRREELCRKIQAVGLSVVESRYVDSVGFFASLVYKLIGNDAGDINRVALVAYDRYLFPISRLLDNVFSRWFGKNLLVIGSRKAIDRMKLKNVSDRR